jgi:hypothetical protein
MGLMIMPILNTTLMVSLDNRRCDLVQRKYHSFSMDRNVSLRQISAITQEEMDTLPRVYIHG